MVSRQIARRSSKNVMMYNLVAGGGGHSDNGSFLSIQARQDLVDAQATISFFVRLFHDYQVCNIPPTAAARLDATENFQADLDVRCCLLSVVSRRPDVATIYLPHNPLAKFEERVAESTLSSVCYQFQTISTNVFEGKTSDPTRGVIRLIERPIENMIPVVCEVAACPPACPSPRKTLTLPNGRPRALPASKTMAPSISRPRKSGKDSPTRLVVQGIQSPEFLCFIVKAAFGKRVCDGMEKAQSYILDLKVSLGSRSDHA
ncbi:hypothetical protein LY78DRAFT_683582 [Colletotrichum sublineola]|nr:hypothetical protein LY78DRAFT_683582 [Colletotrichum sublineola]